MALPAPSSPSAKYLTNIEEFRSHSAVLFNERLAILFYLLDMSSVQLNTFYNVNDMLKTRAYLLQIYKNIRTVIRNNPVMRSTLGLDTKEPGVYVPDVVFKIIDDMVNYCQQNQYTYRRLYIITTELNKLEMMLKDTLQYFHYFLRPAFKQKPDMEIATDTYKQIADTKTVDQLRAVVGRNHKIDFEELGMKRIGLNDNEFLDEDKVEGLPDDGKEDTTEEQ